MFAADPAVFHVKHGSEELTVSRETRDRLETYVAELLRWNASLNLIGRATEAEIWSRHVEDSLQLAELLPAGTVTILDVGSGAGFPGLVIAISTGIQVRLVESDQRKCAFLREAARLTEASVVVDNLRLERLAPYHPDVITARGVAPLLSLLNMTNRFFGPRTVALFPKGIHADQELTDAKSQWHMKCERLPSLTSPNSVILRISEVQPLA